MLRQLIMLRKMNFPTKIYFYYFSFMSISKEQKNPVFSGCFFKIHIGKYELKFTRKISEPNRNVIYGEYKFYNLDDNF